MKSELPTRVTALVVIAELLFVVAVVQSVRAESQLSNAATESERAYRAIEAYWREHRSLPSAVVGMTELDEFSQFASGSSSWNVLVLKSSPSRTQHTHPLELEVGRPEENSAADILRSIQIRVRSGSTILYRDPSRGCWRLPPPFGPRCWYP